MIHRVVCLILIAALPVNQAAMCCAHVHEGQDDSTTHVHLPWTSHESHSHAHHAHGHHHGYHHHGSDDHLHHPEQDASQHDAELKRDTESSLDYHEEAVVFCTVAKFLNTDRSSDLDDSPRIAFGCVVESELQPSCSDKAISNFRDTTARIQCAILLQTCCLRI